MMNLARVLAGDPDRHPHVSEEFVGLDAIVGLVGLIAAATGFPRLSIEGF